MQKYTRQTNWAEHMDHGTAKHDTSYNNSNVGRPFTNAADSAKAAPQAPKYNIFGSAGVGDHFGRSSSPKGKSPRV